MSTWTVGRLVVAASLVMSSGPAWAQALTGAELDTMRAAVDAEVQELVTELATQDPDLAAEIMRQHDIVVNDLEDNGHIDEPELVRTLADIEQTRQVMERSFQQHVETRISEAQASGNPELADKMRQMFEAYQHSGVRDLATLMQGPEMGGPHPEGFQGPGPEMGAMSPEGFQGPMPEGFQGPMDGNYPGGMEAGQGGPDGGYHGGSEFTPEMRAQFEQEFRAGVVGEMKELVEQNPEFRDVVMAEFERFVSNDIEHYISDGHEFEGEQHEQQEGESFIPFHEYEVAEFKEQLSAEEREQFGATLDQLAEQGVTGIIVTGEDGGIADHFADHNSDGLPEHHPHVMHVHENGEDGLLLHDHTDGTLNQPAP